MKNNWDKTFIESLSLYEQHSKCSAKQVACILVKDNNILSIGINGTLSGKTNCNEKFKKKSEQWYKKNEDNYWVKCNNNEHSEWSKLNEVHAEMNAIKKATQGNGFNLEGATAYISYSPCFNCCKMLVLFGIKRIVFKKPYDDIKEVLNFLEDNNVEVVYWDNDIKTLLVGHSGYTIRLDKEGYIHEVSNNEEGCIYSSFSFNLYKFTNNEYGLSMLLNHSLNCKKVTLIRYDEDDVYRNDDFLFCGVYFEKEPDNPIRGRIKFIKDEEDLRKYTKEMQYKSIY